MKKIENYKNDDRIQQILNTSEFPINNAINESGMTVLHLICKLKDNTDEQKTYVKTMLEMIKAFDPNLSEQDKF